MKVKIDDIPHELLIRIASHPPVNKRKAWEAKCRGFRAGHVKGVEHWLTQENNRKKIESGLEVVTKAVTRIKTELESSNNVLSLAAAISKVSSDLKIDWVFDICTLDKNEEERNKLKEACEDCKNLDKKPQQDINYEKEIDDLKRELQEAKENFLKLNESYSNLSRKNKEQEEKIAEQNDLIYSLHKIKDENEKIKSSNDELNYKIKKLEGELSLRSQLMKNESHDIEGLKNKIELSNSRFEEKIASILNNQSTMFSDYWQQLSNIIYDQTLSIEELKEQLTLSNKSKELDLNAKIENNVNLINLESENQVRLPDNIFEFEDRVSACISNKQCARYVIKLFKLGKPIISVYKTAEWLARLYCACLGISASSIEVVHFSHKFNAASIANSINQSSARFIILDGFLGNFQENLLIPQLREVVGKVIFLTTSFEKTIEYIPEEIFEYCSYINLEKFFQDPNIEQTVKFLDFNILEESLIERKEINIDSRFVNQLLNVKIPQNYYKEFLDKEDSRDKIRDNFAGLLLFGLIPLYFYKSDTIILESLIKIIQKSKNIDSDYYVWE